MKTILVTGGGGYIGSHTVVHLLQKNFNVVIIDNLCNCKEEIVDKIQLACSSKPIFYQGDIRNRPLLSDIFSDHCIHAVIHFAGLKAVADS